MISTVKLSAYLGDSTDRQSSRNKSEQDTPRKERSKLSAPQADLRLTIEQDEASEELLYKLIDRASGQVVAEVSREDLVKLGDDPSYTAGALFSANA